MPRPGPAFSNSTEGEIWMSNWCDRCMVDAPYRNGLKGAIGCELILTAITGDIPDEWWTSEDGEYRCLNFKPPGGRSPEPRPRPEPPDMDGLFDRPQRRVRMLKQEVDVRVRAT